MKKIFKMTGLMVAAMFACCVASFAQGNGSDEFAGVITRLLAVNSFNNTAVTNAPQTVDLLDMVGIAKIDVFSAPDNVAGTEIIKIQTSPDTTNWSTMGSCAINSGNAISRTNFYYGSTGIANTFTNLNPQAVTTPTASSAGFATVYSPALVYTNTALWTNTGPAVVEFGFKIADQPRYARVVVTAGGSGTNFAFGAAVTGTPKY